MSDAASRFRLAGFGSPKANDPKPAKSIFLEIGKTMSRAKAQRAPSKEIKLCVLGVLAR